VVAWRLDRGVGGFAAFFFFDAILCGKNRSRRRCTLSNVSKRSQPLDSAKNCRRPIGGFSKPRRRAEAGREVNCHGAAPELSAACQRVLGGI